MVNSKSTRGAVASAWTQAVIRRIAAPASNYLSTFDTEKAEILQRAILSTVAVLTRS